MASKTVWPYGIYKIRSEFGHTSVYSCPANVIELWGMHAKAIMNYGKRVAVFMEGDRGEMACWREGPNNKPCSEEDQVRFEGIELLR
jgi:hypothetical protein